MRRLDKRVSVGTTEHRCVFIGHDDEKVGVLFCGHGVCFPLLFISFNISLVDLGHGRDLT